MLEKNDIETRPLGRSRVDRSAGAHAVDIRLEKTNAAFSPGPEKAARQTARLLEARRGVRLIDLERRAKFGRFG
jgi:hypothetical protein